MVKPAIQTHQPRQGASAAIHRVQNVMAGRELGFSFIPMKAVNGRKKPQLKDWPNLPKEDEATAIKYAQNFDMVALRTGKHSSPNGRYLLVIDQDNGGDLSGLQLPQTVTAITGKGGRHLYFYTDEPLGNSTGKISDHIDTRCVGGCAVYPGSIHPETRKMYKWADGLSIFDIGIAELPKSVIEKLKPKPPKVKAQPIKPTENQPYIDKVLAGCLDELQKAPEGQRNQTLNAMALRLGQFVAGGYLIRLDIEEQLYQTALEIGLDESEIMPTIQSGLTKGMSEPDHPPGKNQTTNGDIINDEPEISDAECSFELHLTEQGNGERFAQQHSHCARYCHTWKKWLYFDGRRWATDCEDKISHLAKKIVRDMYHEAASCDNEQVRKELARHAVLSETRRQRENMLWYAAKEIPICCWAKDFDKNIWLLNCLNGTIDLRTGELKPHNPDDMITKICPMEYNPDAQLDMWDKFLAETTDNDFGFQAFLQQAVGYSLTGDTREEKLFFVHGPAATGKSTFLEAVKAALGDYAQTADFETFLKRNQAGSIRNDIARLSGTRLVASIELEDGKKLAEGLVKQLTGGDTITARFLRQEHFEFLPQFKLWLAANDEPRVNHNDDAIWRRLLEVPFKKQVPEDKRDPDIKATLTDPKKAGPAILAWAVRGCQVWLENGLFIPDAVTQATREYKLSQDPLREFIEDYIAIDARERELVKNVRAVYEKYAAEIGMKYTLNPAVFNKRLEQLGCEKKNMRDESGVSKYWLGLRLKGFADD
ncbi:phage/plasmid primase, P4 family [Planctomycetota bacterium]